MMLSVIMTALSSIDVAYIIRELQDLIGHRLDTVYQLGEQEFLLQFHVSGKGKQSIRIMPTVFWRTTQQRESVVCSGFCAQLRKYLEGRKLQALEQIGSERIVRFVFGKEQLQLFVEFFGGGNVVLCDKDNMILGCSQQKIMALRTLKPGVCYEAPQTTNMFALKEQEFMQHLQEIDSTISKTLAVHFGLGKLYAEEACVRTGIDVLAKHVTDAQKTKLYDALQLFVHEKSNARVVFSNNAVVTVTPFALRIYAQHNQQQHLSFSEAFDAIQQLPSAKAVEAAKKKYVTQLAKLENAIMLQQKSLAGLEKKSVEEQRKGEVIYERYMEVKKVLDGMKEARKQYSLKELKELLKKNNILVDEKTGEFTIELKE